MAHTEMAYSVGVTVMMCLILGKKGLGLTTAVEDLIHKPFEHKVVYKDGDNKTRTRTESRLPDWTAKSAAAAFTLAVSLYSSAFLVNWIGNYGMKLDRVNAAIGDAQDTVHEEVGLTYDIGKDIIRYMASPSPAGR